MTTLTISDYLKYANLQMAAEAFLVDDNGALKTNIKQGNQRGQRHLLFETMSQ